MSRRPVPRYSTQPPELRFDTRGKGVFDYLAESSVHAPMRSSQEASAGGYSDGTMERAEIHWYEANGIGRKEFKHKRTLYLL